MRYRNKYDNIRESLRVPLEEKNLAVRSTISGDVFVNEQFVGNFQTDPSLLFKSEPELLELGTPAYSSQYGGYGSKATTFELDPSGINPYDTAFPTESTDFFPQDAPGGPVRDPLEAPDPDDPYDPFNVNPVVDFINTVTQPIIDTFPDWGDDSYAGDTPAGFQYIPGQQGDTQMGMSYGSSGPQPSMCKLALMNKALIAIVQAGAVTSAGNPLLGVVGSILSNGLRRLGVGADWGRRIFGGSQDADTCQRIVEEAIAVGYLRIPKPNADGSLPANMQITLDPDSPRATLQWRRKAAATRRAPVRRAAPRRRTYRRRT